MDDVFVCVHTCAALVAAVAVASEEVKDAVSSRTSRFSAGEKELNPQNLRVGGGGQQQVWAARGLLVQNHCPSCLAYKGSLSRLGLEPCC